MNPESKLSEIHAPVDRNWHLIRRNEDVFLLKLFIAASFEKEYSDNAQEQNEQQQK
jgi:hypothetical protein